MSHQHSFRTEVSGTAGTLASGNPVVTGSAVGATTGGGVDAGVDKRAGVM